MFTMSFTSYNPLFNTFFPSHNYRFVVVLVRTSKLHSHPTFTVYNAILLKTVSMLYSRSLPRAVLGISYLPSTFLPTEVGQIVENAVFSDMYLLSKLSSG